MKNNITKEQAYKLFEKYSPYVFRTAFLLTKSEALADDITQETFVKVYRKYHTYDKSKSITPWIYKITINTARNALKKQKWLQFIGELPDIDSGENIENLVLKSIEEKELWEEVNRLSDKSREIIVLHFYTGLKLSEVSDVLGIPIGTCKSRLNTALNILRKNISNKRYLYIMGGECLESDKL